MNMSNFFKRSFVLILIIFSISLYAQQNGHAQDFNVKNAYTKLQSISEKLADPTIKLNESRSLAAELRTLRSNAQACVTKEEEKLKTINSVMASIHLLQNQQTIKLSAEYQYLQERKETAAKRASDCHLFLFRSSEPIEMSAKTIRKLGSNILFQHSAPIWQIVQNTQLSIKGIKLRNSGAALLSLFQWGILTIILALSLIMGFVCREVCRRCLSRQTQFGRVSVILLAVVKRYMMPFLFLGGATAFFATVFSTLSPQPSLSIMSLSLFIYICFLSILSFILAPPRPAFSLLREALVINRTLFNRLFVLSTLLVVGLLFVLMFQSQIQDEGLIALLQTIYFIAMSVVVIWTCWLFDRFPFFNRANKVFTIFVKVILIALLIGTIIFKVFGYHRLSLYLISRPFLTFAVGYLFWLAIMILNLIEQAINFSENNFAKFIRYYLGIKPYKRLSEIVFIKLAIFLVLLYLFFISLLLIWGISAQTITIIDNAILEGFKVFNMHFVPSRIVIALIAFAFLSILGRWFASYLSRHRTMSAEKDVQNTVDSIISYVTFAIAFLLSLLIAGVNFTGLAVVAGALSVGIGFGLQTIVNNFISGIILLLDKNINPGDLIIVNGVEGIIKKISLRSTQVTTLSNEDVIIPNTELFTSKVTNLMLHGKSGQVVLKVNVASHSHMEPIKAVLLDVLHQHEEILQHEPNEPKVLFGELTDESMKLSLLFVVKEVKKKQQVVSELNLMLKKALEKAGVQVHLITG